MSARGGRQNGAYAWVPLRLAHDCPKCGVRRGRKCGRMVADSWVTIQGTHGERKRKRTGKTEGEK